MTVTPLMTPINQVNDLSHLFHACYIRFIVLPAFPKIDRDHFIACGILLFLQKK